MAENDFHTEPESPLVPCEHMPEVWAFLNSQAEILEEIVQLLRKAAPLLDSKAAKIALGVERHPVLSALSGKGARRG